MYEESPNLSVTATSIADVHGFDLEEWVKNESHTYIGCSHDNVEASPWANPYKVDEHGRENELRMYRDKVLRSPNMMNSLHELRGQILGCWCSGTEKCHGQILVDLFSNSS